MSANAPTLQADYFDGLSARPRRVALSTAAGRLRVEGGGVALELPLADVRWPERTRHGSRIAHLPDGASLHSVDAAAWDRWTRASGVAESLVVRSQQSWRGVLVACVLLIAVAAMGYVWGLPLGARAVLAFVPPSADEQIGSAALDSIRSAWLQPTLLPPQRQQQLRASFAKTVKAAFPQGNAPAYTLHFHRSKLGPNAFALPGGDIVVTDELVRLLADDDRAVLGVLAHELGHVRHRHGMRAMVQATLLAAATSMAFGDFSSLIAGAPALLGHMGYSRDFEREADDESVRVMLAAGIPPDVMVKLFERLPLANMDGSIDPPCPPGVKGRKRGEVPKAASQPAPAASAPPQQHCRELPLPGKDGEHAADDDGMSILGIGFSSHPAHRERIERFRAATPEALR